MAAAVVGCAMAGWLGAMAYAHFSLAIGLVCYGSWLLRAEAERDVQERDQ